MIYQEIPSEITKDIETIQLICSLFYKSAESQFWKDRESELWQYAFSSLIAPDLLAARGLNPEEVIRIYPSDWFEDGDEDEVILFSLKEDRYTLIMLTRGNSSLNLEFNRVTTSISVTEELLQNPILKQKAIITALLCTRLALEYTKLHGITA